MQDPEAARGQGSRFWSEEGVQRKGERRDRAGRRGVRSDEFDAGKGGRRGEGGEWRMILDDGEDSRRVGAERDDSRTTGSRGQFSSYQLRFHAACPE